MIDLKSYNIFVKNKKTLKETSKDDSNPADIQYMTESELEVVDFDMVKRDYVNTLGLSEDNAASIDAVVQFEDHIAFVEFKNGKVNNRNIKDKARDSLLIFSDITKKSTTFTRDKVDFIVVYNSEKNPLPNQMKKAKLQESPSRIAIARHFMEKAQKELILFDLERYEKLYFRKVHTYSTDMFEKYLSAH